MTTNWDDARNHKICPHWSLTGRNCMLCKEGLYLPVAEHVATYCQTGNYTSCPQFLEALIHGDLPGSSPMVERNRRRYDRIPARFSFRLSEFLAEESLENPIDDSASTVDLSPGGLRVESCRPLAVDSRVRFFLTGDSSDSSLGGTGRVRWCRSLDNAPLYHVGIAFADPSFSRKIRSRLGLRMV